MLGEILPDARHELLRPHPGHQLAQYRGALGVRDAVEVDLHVLQVVDFGEDRVGRGQLVLAVGPGLLHRCEGGPRAREGGVFHGREVGHVFGEGFVEPEVVPPAHGHQVTEPHVGEFVQHGDGPALDLRAGDFAAEDVAFEDGHRAGVFHGAGVELGHKQLVVLLERVREAELRLEEFEALAGQLKDVVRVEVLHERLPGKNTQRDHPPVGTCHFAADRLVRTGNQGRDVGGEPRRGGERPDRAGAAVVSGRRLHRCRGGGVGDDIPVRRCRDREPESSLEVGLLKDREHPARIGYLELGVQVDLVVHRIHKAVQSFAGVHVRRVSHYRELVEFRQAGQLDPDSVGNGLRVQGAPVERDAVHRVRDGIDERGGPRDCRELHRGGGPEDFPALGQVQDDIVGVNVDEFGTLAGFGARQVHTWQVGPPEGVAVAGGRWPAPAQ